MKPAFFRLLATILALLTMLTMLTAAHAQHADGMASVTSAPPTPIVRQFSFSQLDKAASLRLTPTGGQPQLDFGRRADETVLKAALRLRYTFSPMLIPLQSHVRILLNQQVIGVLNLSPDDAGRELTQDFPIAPDAIKPFNALSLDFIGHYTGDCEDPLHAGLWMDILRGSALRMSTRRRQLPDELAMLPKPFFDVQDYGRLDLPYVLPTVPSAGLLRAAAITSSWFGALAGTRGARFPVYSEHLPKRHAVVFATNRERPPFLRDAAPFSGPSISVITSPADPYSKLLLITGRNPEDLRNAAIALALGNAAMSGAHVDVLPPPPPAARPPYDAPNWVRLDRPMKFGELIDSPQRLQAFGHVPAPIRLNLRIPPDLFTWLSRGVPVNLKLRYTPPIRSSDSKLTMSVNGEHVQSVKLSPSGHGTEASRVVLPLLDNALGDGRELLIPAFKLGARNSIEYGFSFSYLSAGACRDVQVEDVRAMLDPDSTVDFSGYPHYATMPHLGYFATAGFPFTKYADLSQTTVVMPARPNADEIETMLVMLARMGESTGAAAVGVTVAGPDDTAALRDHDLLLIGKAPRQSLLGRWRDHVPAILEGPQRMIRPVPGRLDTLYQWLGINTDPPADRIAQQTIRGNGPLSAMLGFESPLTSGRSVVAITSAGRADPSRLFDVLQDSEATRTMHGSVVLIHGNIVESIAAGKTYAIGSLPFWTAIWFPLSGHPVLLALMSVIAVLVFAFAIWRTLRAIAAQRLQAGNEE